MATVIFTSGAWNFWTSMRRKLLILGLAGCAVAGILFALRASPPPPILLITLDTTRADRLGCYGYSRARTPALDSLAATGVLCERAYTVAPLTLPAHASLFTGLYPAENGVRTNGRGRLGDAMPTLAEALRSQGYDTAAFVASFVLDGKFGLDRGFVTYDDDIAGDGASGHAAHRQRNGAAVVDAALKWLNQARSRPFFCWVHLYDAHAPYLAHADLFGDEFAERPYDGEIAYVDQQVGRLIACLRERGLDSQTLVVIVGDHGEGLQEHAEVAHGCMLYNATMHVPLIVRHATRLPAGRRVADEISTVDVSATILDLLETPGSRKTGGRSLKPALLGSPVNSSPCYGATDDPLLSYGWAPLRSWTSGNWKYIRTTKVELYDLAADPTERHNLAEEHRDRLQEMESRMADFESRLIERDESAVRLSPAERRTLEGLGYLAGAQRTPAGPASAILPDVKDMLPFDVDVAEATKLAADGAPDAAIDRLRRVIEKAPRHVDAYWALAEILRDQLKFEDAAAVLHDLLKVKPDSTHGHYGLAAVLIRQGHTDAAVSELLKTLEIDPDFAEAHYNLGQIMASAGRPEEALAHFGSAIEIDRAYVEAYRARAELLSKLGRSGEAGSDWLKARKYAPAGPGG